MQKKKRVLSYLWPLGFGAILLLIPLLRDVHLESALLVSTIFSFWGSLSAANKKQKNDLRLFASLSLQIFLIFTPLLINGLLTDCITLSGLGFWLLLPLPSLLFGVSIGRFYRVLNFPFPRIFSFVTLLIVGLGVLAYEFFTLPQVYYFNHVWGAWPGPIYDEEVRVTVGLLWFRLTTFLWVILLWWLPAVSASKTHLTIVCLSGALIVFSLFVQPQLGISTPRSTLKSNLNEVIKTEHFHLYFDSSNFDEQERDYWAARHEFHFNQITNQLEIDWPEGEIIESFIYANAWQKKELVGAKATSYVPVWLEQDQLHIAKEHLSGVLKHEMVHVIAKQFGNNLINASWSIGLIEGVAEAIAKDASGVSTLHQIIAAEDSLPSSQDMESALSITGFYSTASSISYTMAGSFVKYLLDNYPIENFKTAYPKSEFEKAYQIPFDTLVTRWKAQLPFNEIDSVDTQVSQFIFSQQSLFQLNCPRKIHPILKGLDDLQFYESLGDTSNALVSIDNLFTKYPDLPLVKQLWSGYQLRTNNFDLLLNEISQSDSAIALQLMKADALFAVNEFELADASLQELLSDSTFINDSNSQDSFTVRSDSLIWSTFFNARYRNKLVDADVFKKLPVPLQWLLINRSISTSHDPLIFAYGEVMLHSVVNPNWFETQESLINMLVYYEHFHLAQKWIDLLMVQNLRARHQERVLEQQEWLEFYQSYH